ncbi:MAG: ESX secretion-associated protein EspG [Rhodococcus sp.]|nr:ESX secretion-associated protein EspG [Rhodococcus sp. (in: high G+C Gram-positive bacteria)]
MSKWTFDPLAYQVGWRSFGVDHPHYPFQYRPTSETMDEYERECLTAAQRFQSQLDDDLYWAFVTMLNPEARIYACGFTGPGEAEKVRAYVAVRGPHAVLMRQDPGPDHGCGGTVHLSRLPHGRCGDAIAHALPTVDPGRRPRIDVDMRDLENEPEDEFATPTSWLHEQSTQATPKQELEQLLDLPRVGVGRVEVYSGATIGARDTVRVREVRWVDVADDGRYLVASSPRTVSAIPGRDDALSTLVQKLVAAATEESRSEVAV